MEFLARGYEALRGPQGAPQSATETILKLSDRLTHGTLLEDRRAAVLGLKGLSRDWKVEVGQASLGGLIKALESSADRSDVETCKAVLETLNVLCLREQQPPSSSPIAHRRSSAHSRVAVDSGLEFSDILIDTCPISGLLLQILNEGNFYVRWFALQLLTTLLSNRPSPIQDGILSAPGGCGRLIEMLSDRREVIRNEALLLLIALTESNADIQKIIAFGDAFQILFDLIIREDGMNGGIVVQDCLVVVGNLLRYNVSNQNYFRETSCIQRLPELLGYDRQQQGAAYAGSLSTWSVQEWSDQKSINMRVVLSIIKMLLVPGNLATPPNQRALLTSGLLQAILELAVASNAPTRIKSLALYILADAIRGTRMAQEFLSHAVVTPVKRVVQTTGTEPLSTDEMSSATLTSEFKTQWVAESKQPAIIPLISTALGIDGPVPLSQRAAACYAFECLVHENPEAQLAIMSTMTPPPPANPNDPAQEQVRSAGSLILATLTEYSPNDHLDPYSVWFACTMLAHLLIDNEKAKRIARNITFGDSEAGEESVSLVQTIVGNFMMISGTQNGSRPASNGLHGKFQDPHASIGYLCLLCMWLWESPKTVKEFLSEGSNLQLLVAPVSQSSGVNPLVQGLCAFLLGICYEFNRDGEKEGEQDGVNDNGPIESSITRGSMQPILLQRIGVDQFISRITRLRESPVFRDASPELHVIDTTISSEGGTSELDALTFADALPDLVFDYAFVELLKSSFLMIQRSITMDPSASSDHPWIRKDPELVAEAARLRERVAQQEQEVDTLSRKLTDRDDLAVQERDTLLQEITSLSEQVKNLQIELESTRSELTLAKLVASKAKATPPSDHALPTEKIKKLQELVHQLQEEVNLEKGRAEEAFRDKEDFAILLEDTMAKRAADKARMQEAGLEISDTEADEGDE